MKDYSQPDENEAFLAGRDCARNGATTENCHFRFFTTKALKEAWERGKKSIQRTDK